MSEKQSRILQDNKKLSLIKGFLEDKKAEELVFLDLRGLSSVTDTLVVASGHSDRHVQAVSEFLAQEMKHQGYRPLGSEGLKDGRWGLIDYGDVIVHIFYHEIRTHYDLEGVWRDAPVILDERQKG
ncbi:MAG: ribosome silencing factor [Deltaproteobacteria bacterium]|nr:MAG: ribosome silencing factor [Deltaproteobacteria bacterium]